MKKLTIAVWTACAGIIIATGPGCATVQRGIERAQEWWDQQRGKEPGKPDAPKPDGFPAGMRWLGADISGWRVVSDLDAAVIGGTLHLRYSHSRTWPVAKQKATDGGPLVGNVWVIAQSGGTWYAATWDWMRVGQQSKAAASLRGTGGHIQQAPLSAWTGPRSGEQIGLMVSTPARSAERTVNERTSVAWVTWP